MRVLFSTIGAVGHVYPMVPLARALLAAGHEVRWATSAEMCPTVVEAGVPALSAGLSNSDWRDERNRRMRELAELSPAERTFRLAPWIFGELLAPAMLRDLLAVVRSWPPTMFIHDNMELAARTRPRSTGALALGDCKRHDRRACSSIVAIVSVAGARLFLSWPRVRADRDQAG